MQRACACGGTPGPTGECAECRRKKKLGLQTKLRVSRPGDRYEREADRIADRVLRAEAPRAVRTSAAAPQVQRLAQTQEEDDEGRTVQGMGGTVQRSARGTATPSVPESVYETLRTPGRRLDAASQRFMEARLGAGFGDVRIHTDARAAASARAVAARAYTVGRDVVFGAGEYRPQTPDGQRLLAHELVHVVQQTGGGPLGAPAAAPAAGIQAAPGVMLARQNAAQTAAVLGRGGVAGVQLFPSALAGTRVGPSQGPGGLVRDTAPRVSAIIGRLTTLRALAQVLLPLWNTATPFTPPGGGAPVPLVPLTVDDLAKGLLVYNRYFLAVPRMTRWKIGLRFPLPIRIDPNTNEGILHPDQIRALAGTFDPAWLPLLDRLPSTLPAQAAADVQQAARDFLTNNPTMLARGIHLSARAITNALDEQAFILEVFSQAGADAFSLALAFMDNLVNHQVALLAAQTGGAAILARLRALLAAPPAGLTGTQQASLNRANGMLGRTAGVQAQPDPCVPMRALTWNDFNGAPPPPNRFGAQTNFDIQPVAFRGSNLFQATMNRATSWVRPKYKQPTNDAVTGCGNDIAACQQQIATGPGAWWGYPGPPAAQCAATIVPPNVRATTHAQCTTVIGAQCRQAAQAESVRLLQHEQLHFDIACVIANKANAVVAGGRALTRRQVMTRANIVTRQYDVQTNHGCNAARQAQWNTDVQAGLTGVNVP
ncbi:MAG: DUF4157 domain-containing protein [Rhodothermales bacterium]|nr:DUF4157 domain-containing protein [Rhodothermales bacterium]